MSMTRQLIEFRESWPDCEHVTMRTDECTLLLPEHCFDKMLEIAWKENAAEKSKLLRDWSDENGPVDTGHRWPWGQKISYSISELQMVLNARHLIEPYSLKSVVWFENKKIDMTKILNGLDEFVATAKGGSFSLESDT